MNIFIQLLEKNRRATFIRLQLGDILKKAYSYCAPNTIDMVRATRDERESINGLIIAFSKEEVIKEMIYWCRLLGIVILLRPHIGRGNIFIMKDDIDFDNWLALVGDDSIMIKG